MKANQTNRSLLGRIARDIHFWVPVIVLILGFVLLLIIK